MRAPIRPIRGRWPRVLEQRLARFFWQDPALVLNDDATPEQFRQAMSAMYVGDTIKITGQDRHPDADQMLVDHVDLSDAAIADIGASDGSTSVDLVRRIGTFRSYVIADLYLSVDAVRLPRHLVVLDTAGDPVLVAGRRLVAWPATSPVVGRLYRRLLDRARRGPREELLLLNPVTRALLRDDPRVTHRTHDVFATWQGSPPDVIKVANLLRRLYFPDEDLLRALGALHDSLPEGGHLMIVDNPRRLNTPPGGGLWRREGAGFVEVARTGEPEIADLVALVDRSDNAQDKP